MLCYCFKCRKNMQSKNPEVVKRKNNKKSKFLKEQEARGLLSNLLGVKNKKNKKIQRNRTLKMYLSK